MKTRQVLAMTIGIAGAVGAFAVPANASSGGGNLAIPGNTDVRALEAPTDIRPQQLEAQRYPFLPTLFAVAPPPPPAVVQLPRHRFRVRYSKHPRT